jgi:hypothetical protein
MLPTCWPSATPRSNSKWTLSKPRGLCCGQARRVGKLRYMASPAWYGVDPAHIPRRAVERRAAGRGGASAQADASTALPPLTIVTFATAAYVRWIERLHTNLRLLALPAVSRLSVCAGDRVTQQAARAMGLTTFNFSLNLGRVQGRVGELYGTGRYTRIVQAKSACIHAQLVSLEPSALLWFIDGDVTLFGDPRPSFLSLGVDLALMADTIDVDLPKRLRRDNNGRLLPTVRQQNSSCRACTRGSARACFANRGNFNSGFFVMRSVESTRWLWRTMLSYHAGRPEARQQIALNDLIRSYETPSRRIHLYRKAGVVYTAERPPRPLTIAALDESRFLNGNCFYERRPVHAHGLNSSRVLAVHHNYVSGDELKFRRAQAFGAVVQNNDTMQTFLRRARAFMDCVPPWTPLSPWGRDSELSKDRYEPRAKTLKCINRALGRLAPIVGGVRLVFVARETPRSP